MSAIPFDTLAFTKKMTTAGMPQEQAEALAESQAELIENNLATKRDLKELEARLLVKLTVIIAGVVGLFSAIGNI